MYFNIILVDGGTFQMNVNFGKIFEKVLDRTFVTKFLPVKCM